MQTTSDIPDGVDTNDATGTSAGCIGDLAKGSSLQGTLRRIGALFGALLRVPLRDICCATSLLAVVLCPAAWAKEMQPDCPLQKGPIASQTITRASSPNMDEAAERVISADSSEAGNNPSETFQRLIVIGFMGGNVRANNFVHREALLAKDLQQRYPIALRVSVFANHDGHTAFQTVLNLLDKNKDGCLSTKEKSAARIVIYGHSWGASETITLARRLNELSIPVLLTIQVDSVQKLNEDDGRIPPNVREAVNFYQSEGLLHGRRFIEAMDSKQTTILGNFESAYKDNPVSCPGYPWFARAFMKPHIEIENDPSVWSRIEALIQSKIL